MSTVSIRRKISNTKLQKCLIIVSFLFVPLISLLVFRYWTLVKLIQMSFSDWNGFSSHMNFIGVGNYVDAMKDSDVWLAFKNNIAYIVAMIAQNVFGFYFAIIFTTRMRGENFFKTVIFMPYIMNGVAIAFMFNYLYNYTEGPLNLILTFVGLSPIHWLPADSYLINFSLAFIGTWQYTGWCMIIYIAGLKSISKEIYEAADIDGATFFQKVARITIPNMLAIFELNLFLGINGALQAYFQPFIITKGGPNGLSDTFVSKSLSIAFYSNNYGKAAAMGVIMIIMVLLVIGIQRKLMNSWRD